MKFPISITCLAAASRLLAADGGGFEVEAAKSVQLSGRAITFEKVSPPVLARRAAPVAPAVAVETRAQGDAIREAKIWQQLDITATVYPLTPVLTELRVRTDEKEFVCISNVDFGDLTQIGQFEDDSHVYAWFPFVSDGDAADLKRPPGLSATEPSFVVVSGGHNVTALRGLEAVHAYYKLNKARLMRERAAREAEAARREQESRDNPPVKQPITLRFWEMQTAE